MAFSPYTPTKEELVVPEDWKWMEEKRLQDIDEASKEEDLG